MFISRSQMIEYALPFMSIDKTKRRILQRGNRLNVTPPTKLYYDERSPYCVRYILLSNRRWIRSKTVQAYGRRIEICQKTTITVEIHVGIHEVPEQPLWGLVPSWHKWRIPCLIWSILIQVAFKLSTLTKNLRNINTEPVQLDTFLDLSLLYWPQFGNHLRQFYNLWNHIIYDS